MSLERRLRQAAANRDVDMMEHVFEEIYAKHGKLVAYIISKYVGNRQDVEELTNDVFIKFSSLLFSEEIKNIKQYLASMAKNRAIDHIRRNSSHDIIDYVERVDIQHTDEDNTFYNEIIDDMKKELNEEEINIILLHSVYAHKFDEIADMLSKPLPTVKSTYRRAIKKYRRKRGISDDRE